MRRPHIVYLADYFFTFSEKVPTSTVDAANALLTSMKLHMPIGKGHDERAVMHRLGELEMLINSLT
jgi:hypothetical protein